MTRDTSSNKAALAEIFGRINLADLPALSAHVKEIISSVDSRRATANSLAEVILKDFALTNKILQLVNSPYYCRSQPISSVSKAVTYIGFQPIRELALVTGLFEEFIKAGLEKEEISKLLAQSHVSAELARSLCFEKRIRVSPEEVYICTLLHHLGKMVLIVYLPDFFRLIQNRVAAGEDEEAAAAAVLKGPGYQEIGREVARFWNFSEAIVQTMTSSPQLPQGLLDEESFRHVLAVFCNRLIGLICEGKDFSPLLTNYGSYLQIEPEQPQELIDLMIKSAAVAENISPVFRFGLVRLKLRSRLLYLKSEYPQPF